MKLETKYSIGDVVGYDSPMKNRSGTIEAIRIYGGIVMYEVNGTPPLLEDQIICLYKKVTGNEPE